MRDSALRSARVCALVLAAALGLACGDFSGSPSGGDTAAPSDGFLDLSAQAGGVEAFEATLHPIVRQYCVDCHAGIGPGSPHFAQPDPAAAYQALVAQGKVSLGDPPASRLVVKVSALAHHCWSDCVADGATLAAAIQDWADRVQFGGGGVSVEGALASNAVAFDEGIVDTGSERYAGNLLARWEFKEGAGAVAQDTSGVAPAIDLQLVGGVTWLSSWGVAFDGGHLLGSAAASRKLHDAIADPAVGTQQYTVEAWATPANIDQEGPARIVSYSRGGSRNFMLGQVQYTYHVRNRSLNPASNGDGLPALQTADADRDAQDRLQHVVVTYDAFRGRRVYVDGVFTDDVDPIGPGRLWNWDASQRVVMGDEIGGGRPWRGQLRLVAIYRQALTEAQILQNFQAGVGERLLMRFDVGQWMGPGSAVEFIVSDFDPYSYLFCQPVLRTPQPNGTRIANLRIAVNGELATSGQGFESVDTLATAPRQELSRQCTVIPKGGAGPDDSFAIVFEHLGGFQNVVVEDPVPPAPIPLDPTPRPVNGLRDFERLNASFASITGQDPGVAAATFAGIREQLPAGYDVRSFVSSQQVAISKIALDYCDALVEGPGRAGFFPGFDFALPADAAFATPAQRDLAFDPLYDRVVGAGLAMQPTRAEVRGALDALVDQLVASCGASGSCDAARTRSIVKASCSAVLGSAAVALH